MGPRYNMYVTKKKKQENLTEFHLFRNEKNKPKTTTRNAFRNKVKQRNGMQPSRRENTKNLYIHFEMKYVFYMYTKVAMSYVKWMYTS